MTQEARAKSYPPPYASFDADFCDASVSYFDIGILIPMTRKPLHPEIQADESGRYDVRRLSEYLGVKPATIRTMKKRQQLPEPCDHVNGGAVWTEESVRQYFESVPFNTKTDKNGNEMPNGLKVIDLFCGCGGLSQGFRDAGYDVLAGYDNWQPALDTYNANLPEDAHKLDLSDVDESIRVIEAANYPIDGIIGGPPCQDFSTAGKRVEGARADLTEKYAQIVSYFKPRWFLMENVARAERATAFERALNIFSEANYGITKHVINAALCGVPQNRKRLITVGFLNDNFDNEFEPFLLKHLAKKPMTMHDYFGDSLEISYFYRHPRSYARRAVFSIDEPSPTVRGVNRPIPHGYPGHPGDAAPVEQSRPLTTEERARVQTFEGWVFSGSKTNQEQQIGNAVPVQLAKFVGYAIAEYLQSKSTNMD